MTPKPEVIIHVGDDRYGLEWAEGAVQIFRKVTCSIYQGTNGAVWCEWTPVVSGRIPAEVASIISGFCAQRMARDAMPNDGWQMTSNCELVKHYGKVT